MDSSLVLRPSLIDKWTILLDEIFQVKLRVSILDELGLNIKEPSGYFFNNSIALRFDRFFKNGWVNYQV